MKFCVSSGKYRKSFPRLPNESIKYYGFALRAQTPLSAT